MRIIVPGHPKTPPPEHLTTCPECGCKFAFTEDDVRSEVVTTPPKSGSRTVYLKCPQAGCGNKVGVKLS